MAHDESDNWWRSAVVYQIYPRSFADGNGDGVGDIAGIRKRLPHLAALGIDAIWISPWYPSPMADAGYDVSDYRAIDPVFGTLDEADALVTEAHAVGIRVIIDIVPNHTSDQHRWFPEALAAAPGSPERARYLFADGRGPDGAEPPNDWQSTFAGPAWTRTTNPDGTPGQWYLHLFAPEQPDLDWRNPEVRAEFTDTLRFWFERGIDGFRIDVAHGMAKSEAFEDLGGLTFPFPEGEPDGREHPHWDQPGVHEIFREWRAVADEYPGTRVFVAEAWVGRSHRLAAYLRPDELHTAFNFEFLQAPLLPDQLRAVIDSTLAAHSLVGAPATWVLSNHDVPREVSRYARDQHGLPHGQPAVDHLVGVPTDFDLGARRARAAALLMLALPGGAYIYQGAELGLPEVEDIPPAARQDPIFSLSQGSLLGRDGCRVPLPWGPEGSNAGFSPDGAAPAWLPQPEDWQRFAAVHQVDDPTSTLSLYRDALRLRRELPALGEGDLTWVESAPDVIAFARTPDFQCWMNLGTEPVALPEGATVLLASEPDVTAVLPPATAAWFSPSH